MRLHPLLTSSIVLFAFGSTAFAAEPETATAPDSPFSEMDRYFQAHPELQGKSGTGWKPYNRLKWLHERRMDGGQPPAADARWKAWEEKQRREVATGPSVRSTWFALGPANFAGRMLAIDFDATNPSIVYAGAAGGGVFKSTDSGTSWTAVTDGIPSLGVGALAVSRTNPSVVVIGTGEGTLNIDRVHGVGILRSTDAGATWQPTSLTYPSSTAHGFHFATAGPSGTLLAGAVDGMFRSTDDGATWTEVMPTVGSSFTSGWYDAHWAPLDPSRVYAVKGNDSATNGVHVSTDDGATWALVGTGQPASTSFGKSKLAVSGNTVYCYVGNQGFGGGVFGLIRSTDDGATWVTAGGAGLPTGQSWYNLSCVADPNNTSRVLCGAVTLSRSNDGGDSFNSVGSNVHVDHHALAYEPGSNIHLWACSDGGVWFSPTDGTNLSWVDKNAGVVSYQFYDICVNNGANPYYVMGGTQDNGTDKWSGTTTWAEGLGADGMVCNISATSGTTVYAETQNGGHNKSTNSGGSFVSIMNGINGTGRWVTPVDLDQTDDNRAFTETSNGVFRTTDGGALWVNVTASRAVWISISPIDPDVVWIINGGSVQRSTNGGNSWGAVSGFPFSVGNEVKIYADPVDVSTAFACFSSYSNVATLARTTDDGASWTDVSGDLPLIPVNGIAVHPMTPNDWYIATDLGVWHSSNGGANWLPYATGLPNVVVDDIEVKIVPGKLVAGTHGRGAWEIDLGVGLDAEVDVAGGAPPRNLMFDEPWPNPAKDRTLLRYAAKSSAAVTLRIYDVRGRLVSDLEGFARGDGIIRTTPWFPDDVPSGVYLAVLESGAERITRKITVLR